MLSWARAAPFVAMLALLAAALAFGPAASADGGPRLKAYDYALSFAGLDEEGDYIWRYGFTMCTSHAARVKAVFIVRSFLNARGDSISGYTVDYLDKRRAGCKRYRVYFDRNVDVVRALVRLWWRGERVIAPLREARCEPRCP